MIFAKSEDQIPELLIIINPNDHYNSLNLPENINCETMKIIIWRKTRNLWRNYGNKFSDLGKRQKLIF